MYLILKWYISHNKKACIVYYQLRIRRCRLFLLLLLFVAFLGLFRFFHTPFLPTTGVFFTFSTISPRDLTCQCGFSRLFSLFTHIFSFVHVCFFNFFTISPRDLLVSVVFQDFFHFLRTPFLFYMGVFSFFLRFRHATYFSL